uniref:Uncharacterized protein n=1 Tax=Strigamia maritima TaxID=126957 RepID=T1IGT3_STRMM
MGSLLLLFVCVGFFLWGNTSFCLNLCSMLSVVGDLISRPVRLWRVQHRLCICVSVDFALGLSVASVLYSGCVFGVGVGEWVRNEDRYSI